MKKKKIIIISVILVLIVILITFNAIGTKKIIPKININDISVTYPEGSYEHYALENKNVSKALEEITIAPSDLVISERYENLTTNTEGYNKSDKVFYWSEDSTATISFKINIPETALYRIKVDYLSKVKNVIDTEINLTINDDNPFLDTTQITLGTLWKESTENASKDRYGNDVNMLQEPFEKWQSIILTDSQKINKDGFLFKLEKGTNTIKLTKNNGELVIGNIYLTTDEEKVSYLEYRGNVESATHYYKRFEAEKMYYKSSSTISMSTSREVGVLPFSVGRLKLNIIGDGSWNLSGDTITWKVNVPTSGFYKISLKVLQETENTTVYRTIYINGKLPFDEAKHLPFSYYDNWQNVTIHGLDGTEYEFYLNEGDNEISLEVDSSLYANISERLSQITTEMTTLGLNITKYTNGNTSSGIDWNLEENFTTIRSDINSWITELKNIIKAYNSITGFNKTTQLSQDLNSAITKLNKILKNIDALPRRLTLLSEGSSCAAQLVAGQIDSVLTQGLVVDSIFVHSGNSKLPNPKPNTFKTIWVGIQRFFLSFFADAYKEKSNKNELVVWVNRSRQYVDILQKLSDDVFTNEEGIKVKISLMSDDGKLILANSANQNPDVALGVSAWIPNDYGMRGMLVDLRKFNGYTETIKNYNSEQLVPMTYKDQLFGLPETENFYVLVYRKDILEELSLNIPNTWDDVTDMLPVLKRYGMDFYIPLSSSSSSKSFDTTSPFIYQFGGDVYSLRSDGMVTGGLENENTIQAMEFITDLYTEYGLPYQVSNFFNEFRYARIPIGICEFGTYLNLLNAAPELKGLWDITVVPGIKDENGNVKRYMPGAQQAGIIFEKSSRKADAWKFLNWWMSTDTQTLYSETMVNTLGGKYLWNTANLKAFEQLSWNKDHKKTILEQWSHLKEVSRIPGYYIVEREISNTWNSVVYNDANLRSTLSDAMIKINKEITRKMKEFGYVNDAGKVIVQYNMPTAEKIKNWKEDKDDSKK